MSPLILPPVDSSKDHLANVKAFETWGDLYANQQSYHVPIGMDSYAELDFASIDFVRSIISDLSAPPILTQLSFNSPICSLSSTLLLVYLHLHYSIPTIVLPLEKT